MSSTSSVRQFSCKMTLGYDVQVLLNAHAKNADQQLFEQNAYG